MPISPTVGTIPGMGNVGMNWYGSFPTFQADACMEPNFRLFDMATLEEEPGSPELIERVYNVPQGQAHYSERIGGGCFRTTPVMFPVMYTTLCVNLAYTRFHNKSPRRWRGAIFPIFFFAWIWHNGAHFTAREKHFLMDWWKNQSFAIDEMKRLRDEQRVREGIYSSQFIDDPVAEYKLKEWLTANRVH